MDYEGGLEALRAQLERTNRYEEFTTLEARLRENLDDERLFGGDEATRRERARIVNGLNRLALDALGISFNDLVLDRRPAAAGRSAGELRLVAQLGTRPAPEEVRPPVQPRLQALPLNELSWAQFEAVCAALVEAQAATLDCHLYGVPGDDQRGIDIVARQRGAEGEETWAYQCKRYQQYSAGQLREAIDKLAYPADYYVLMLSIPATAALRQVAEERADLFLWDGLDISRKLKNYPALVEDFFGAAWRQAFAPETENIGVVLAAKSPTHNPQKQGGHRWTS